MKIISFDQKYSFLTIFDSEKGHYMRSGIINKKGKDIGEDPFMASFPHLIDVGIMGHCIHGKKGLCLEAGIGCYQSGNSISEPNMKVEDFKSIVEESKSKVHQIALGGRGDPDQHENFEEILHVCRENNIVPNFTTSGYGMNQEIANICKKYCGAVAVSWYRSGHTEKAINCLINAGVKTNIHYVLSKTTIDEAVDRLKNNDFPKGINAIIFLLHKPVGFGKQDDVLTCDMSKVKDFFELSEVSHPFKFGMDSCTIPGVLNYCSKVIYESLDTCEGARFSCYIGPDMTMVPCSFDQTKKYAHSLKESNIQEAWDSEEFEKFRNKLRYSCPKCVSRELCFGGCPLTNEIVLCDKKERYFMPLD